jgi:glyoxylase-like metal-dependent hydrolase (beta-lactamase superfamily II)
MTVTPLTDGYLDPTVKFLREIQEENIRALLMLQHRDGPPRASVNAFAIRSDKGTFLIDTGSGDTMGPTCGRLPQSLAAAGIAPGEVDAIILTHVHPDHSNGLTDLATKLRLFSNAEVLLHEKELNHWFNDDAMARADERARRRYFEAGRAQLGPYIEADRVRTFKGGEILPGVSAVPCHGHTPGHTAYMIGSGRGAILVWGDTVHVQEVQLPFPDVTVIFDWDPAAAAASRRRLFEQVVADGLIVAGAHLHFPGFGQIVRKGPGYRLVQEPLALEM